MSGNVFDTIDQTFAAGEDKTFYFNGAYFELVTCPFPVTVEFMSREGSVLGTWRNAEQGAYARGEFAWLRITSPQAQTIKAYYGPNEVGTRRSSGSVTIAAPIEIGATTQTALADRLRTPLQHTGEYFSQAALAINTGDVVFTPATNTNGAVILSAQISTRLAGALDPSAFIMHSAPPTAIGQGARALLSRPQMQDSGTNISMVADLPNAVYVPPAVGLYYLSSIAIAAANGNFRQCRYRLL